MSAWGHRLPVRDLARKFKVILLKYAGGPFYSGREPNRKPVRQVHQDQHDEFKRSTDALAYLTQVPWKTTIICLVTADEYPCGVNLDKHPEMRDDSDEVSREFQEFWSKSLPLLKRMMVANVEVILECGYEEFVLTIDGMQEEAWADKLLLLAKLGCPDDEPWVESGTEDDAETEDRSETEDQSGTEDFDV